MLLLCTIFFFGYMAIVFENSLKLNKAGAALLTGTTLWALLNLYPGYETGILHHHLSESMGEIAGIVFFILSAMVIVEIIDTHHGFSVVFDLIRTKNTRSFIWIAGWGTFFLSAILDNLTTTIVMVSMLKKTNMNTRQKMFAASVFIIAANAGGIWSPIGDITTTMLWVNEKITTGTIIYRLFLPSVVSFLVPLLIVSFLYFKKGEPFSVEKNEELKKGYPSVIFTTGICLLAAVPVFKTLLHIPPYLAMMLSLGIFWIIIEVFFRKRNSAVSDINSILKKLDYSTV
ncbi:MAG: sodium:proton antiporter NhaD, partial [Victivallales bacterium]